MVMAPYPGQGTPLSEAVGYSGDWIVGGEFFLCPGIGDETAALRHRSGKLAIGFSADRLAQEFGISTDDLLSANRKKKLSIQESPSPKIAGKTITRLFGFPLGTKLTWLQVEQSDE